jgi:hypothetical protein
MKKLLLMLLIAASPSIVFAQLRVNSNGKVGVGAQQPVACTLLNVNGESLSDYSIGIQTKNFIGNESYNVGVLSGSYFFMDTNTGRSMGVIGVGGQRAGGYNYGVVGGLLGPKDGAGIFGTLSNTTGVYVNGRYAGYFDGPTYCTGSITATSYIIPSDITLRENILPLADSKAPLATLNRVMGMNVISYNYKDKEIPEAERDTISPELAKARYSVAKNRHYGLSAQELQAIYPDLVYEGQDGKLGVNYVELVPILIQSIQELNQKVDELENEKAAKTRSVGDDTSDFSAVTTGNVLYQNTPNPFKEQTVIRFSLADDATNAAICIFDMSGKMLKKLPVSSGMTSVFINGWELGEGLYLYSLVVNGREIDTKRMIITN